jgi:hypothetical protein
VQIAAERCNTKMRSPVKIIFMLYFAGDRGLRSMSER